MSLLYLAKNLDQECPVCAEWIISNTPLVFDLNCDRINHLKCVVALHNQAPGPETFRCLDCNLPGRFVKFELNEKPYRKEYLERLTLCPAPGGAILKYKETKTLVEICLENKYNNVLWFNPLESRYNRFLGSEKDFFLKLSRAHFKNGFIWGGALGAVTLSGLSFFYDLSLEAVIHGSLISATLGGLYSTVKGTLEWVSSIKIVEKSL